MTKGKNIKDWLQSGKMTTGEVTTGRIFLTLGVTLGFLLGGFTTILIYLFYLFTS